MSACSLLLRFAQFRAVLRGCTLLSDQAGVNTNTWGARNSDRSCEDSTALRGADQPTTQCTGGIVTRFAYWTFFRFRWSPANAGSSRPRQPVTGAISTFRSLTMAGTSPLQDIATGMRPICTCSTCGPARSPSDWRPWVGRVGRSLGPHRATIPFTRPVVLCGVARTGTLPPSHPHSPGLVNASAIHPTVSTSGRLVYAHRNLDSNIWRLDLASPGAAPTRVVASTRNDGHPHLSQDGTKLVFSSDRTGSREIWMSDSTGANSTQLTRLRGEAHSPKWSPDGTRIVFSFLSNGNRDIYTMDRRQTRSAASRKRQIPNASTSTLFPRTRICLSPSPAAVHRGIRSLPAGASRGARSSTAPSSTGPARATRPA